MTVRPEITPTILAIDCSQRISHIVLNARGNLFARAFEATRSSEREAFWDELRALFESAACTPSEVDAIAIATGPGGFTGLRVSIACAKALALARDVKLIALPSARVFAASDIARGGNGPWLIALAAKNDSAWCIHAATRGESASFQADSISFDAASILGADEFAARVTLVAREGGALLADEHLGSELTQLAIAAGLTQRALQTDSATLATLAVQAFARNDFIDPYALAPIYAREPEAVTKWRALHDA